MSNEVKMVYCAACEDTTGHKSGKCMECAWYEEKEKEYQWKLEMKEIQKAMEAVVNAVNALGKIIAKYDH